MNDLIAISAIIGDRSYRIKINPQDEEVVRKTLKTINDKIVEFKTMFAGKDMQDYIAMVLVWYATEQHAGTTISVEKENLAEQLHAIETLLDNQLNEIKKPAAQ
jgi:stringent starvation protein B